MNDDVKTKAAECPSKEDLSEWYDNGGSERIATHVDDCDECDKTVTFYRRVDETVRLTAEAPEYLSKSVMEACHAVEGEILAFPAWMRALRIAAAAALVATVGGVIYLIGPGTGNNVDNDSVVQADPSAGETEVAAFVTPDGSSRVQPRTGGPGVDSVSGSDVMAVSTTGVGSGRRKIATPVATVKDAVRHVWVVKDMETSKKALLKVLPQGTKPLETDTADGKCSFEAVMTDVQLQELVNGLQDQGWALFTKDWPQPHEDDKVALDGRRVRYVIDLVKKTD